MARRKDSDPPRDILAAEAFALGEGDRDLQREPPHDVLAAEAFAMPGADRGGRHAPRDEHSGDRTPHDVLSAEEYAMPASAHHAVPPGQAASVPRRGPGARRLVGAAAALVVMRAFRRARRQA